MKLISLVTIFLVIFAASTIAATEPGMRERAFVHALELFDSAKTPNEYRESARVLESILDDGYRSGAVYYNLGNAYYRAGEYGRAILNYRKAKPYRPRDPYLTANLEQALASAPGRLIEPAPQWWTHVLFWTDWISFPTKVRATLICLSLVAIFGACAFLFRMPKFQLSSAGLLLVSVALGTDVAVNFSEITDSRRAVIIGETIARKGTENSYEPAFDQPLKDGAEFQILSETSDWVFGHFESIGDGWVRKEFIAR